MNAQVAKNNLWRRDHQIRRLPRPVRDPHLYKCFLLKNRETGERSYLYMLPDGTAYFPDPDAVDSLDKFGVPLYVADALDEAIGTYRWLFESDEPCPRWWRPLNESTDEFQLLERWWKSRRMAW